MKMIKKLDSLQKDIKNENMNKIVNMLIDAVTASGKSFKDIEKSSIYAFLEKQNIPRDAWDKIYSKLDSVFSGKKDTVTNSVSTYNEQTTYDYSDSSHNDVKVRTPRKTVFSEIKKIAG
jgi:hypothetical protein